MSSKRFGGKLSAGSVAIIVILAGCLHNDSGRVVRVGNDRLTIEEPSTLAYQTLRVTASTKIYRQERRVTLDDLAPGDFVQVESEQSSDGDTVATRVLVTSDASQSKAR